MTETVVNHVEAEELAWMRAGSSNLARCYLAALAAIDAASWYINATERELADAGTTREAALARYHELNGPISLDLENIAATRGNRVDYANAAGVQRLEVIDMIGAAGQD